MMKRRLILILLAGGLALSGAGRHTALSQTVSEGGFDPLLLDLKGDGINLGGHTTTELVTGERADLRWPKAGTDDAFLLLDATSLREAGFLVMNAKGEQVDGNTLFKDGLKLKTPDGKEVIIADGWQLLGLFDTNKDEKINAADRVWRHLRLFVDKDADGTIGKGELTNLSSSNVRDIVLTGKGATRTDEFGNTWVEGTFTKTDGKAGLIAEVLLKLVRKILLTKDAKVNGYAIVPESGCYRFEPKNVIDPVTGKPLEGKYLMVFECGPSLGSPKPFTPIRRTTLADFVFGTTSSVIDLKFEGCSDQKPVSFTAKCVFHLEFKSNL